MSNLVDDVNDDAKVEYETWQLPDVDDLNPDNAYGKLLTAGQIEKIQQQAYDEGYEQGFNKGESAGYDAGSNKVEEQAALLKSLLEFQSEPLNEVNEHVISQLVDLSTTVAKQVIRRELRIDSGQVVAVIRECIKSLPVSARSVILFLHPDDATIVREAFSLEHNDEVKWRIEEDPLITRGGCKISAEHSTIDSSVEQQLNRIISKMLGGEREEDANN